MKPFKKKSEMSKKQKRTATGDRARREILTIESLEPRRCMAIDLIGTELRVVGSEHRDVVNFTIGRGNFLTATRDQYETTATGTIKTTEKKSFDAALVAKLTVQVAGNNDTVSNFSSIPMSASGGDGNDILKGGSGQDLLFGQSGNDQLFGNDGNDQVIGGSGNDIMRGGNDNDSLSDSEGANFFFGDEGNDSLTDGGGASSLRGGSGDDQIWGGGGNDTMFGEAGADFISGGDGDDAIRGGVGTDSLRGDFGNDILYGLTNDQATTAFDDANTLRGGDGNDILYGAGGTDSIHGDSGLDLIDGGGSNDFIYGGSGNDTMFGNDGDDQLKGDSGNDWLSGGAGNDLLLGSAGDDLLDGEAGNDTLKGEDNKDRLKGGAGNDLLEGGQHDDYLEGQEGDDQLFGNSGRDVLIGGLGQDQMTGGTDADKIVAVDGVIELIFAGDNQSTSSRDELWLDDFEGLVNIATINAVKNIDPDAVHLIKKYRNYNVYGVPYTAPITLGVALKDPSPTAEDVGDVSLVKAPNNIPLFPTSGIAYDNIDQGAIGTCYFLARLSSLAKTHPQHIRDMVTELGDGSYAVQFYDQSGNKVFVRVDSDFYKNDATNDVQYVRYGASQGMWAAVIEKAWAIHRYGSGSYDQIEGGNSATVSTSKALGLNHLDIWAKDYTPTSFVNMMLGALNVGQSVIMSGPSNISDNLPLNLADKHNGEHVLVVHSIETNSVGQPTKVKLYNLYGGPLVEMTNFSKLQYFASKAVIFRPV
jgi:Ca2+-binding RTX toxin-like protein